MKQLFSTRKFILFAATIVTLLVVQSNDAMSQRPKFTGTGGKTQPTDKPTQTSTDNTTSTNNNQTTTQPTFKPQPKLTQEEIDEALNMVKVKIDLTNKLLKDGMDMFGDGGAILNGYRIDKNKNCLTVTVTTRRDYFYTFFDEINEQKGNVLKSISLSTGVDAEFYKQIADAGLDIKYIYKLAGNNQKTFSFVISNKEVSEAVKRSKNSDPKELAQAYIDAENKEIKANGGGVAMDEYFTIKEIVVEGGFVCYNMILAELSVNDLIDETESNTRAVKEVLLENMLSTPALINEMRVFAMAGYGIKWKIRDKDGRTKDIEIADNLELTKQVSKVIFEYPNKKN